MEEDRLQRLTNAQREVLRLWHVRKSAKEIGRELGITHWAVNERLRSARRVLGVATSGEAARLLAEAEAGGAYKRLVCDPPGIAPSVDHVMFSTPDEDGEEPSRARRRLEVREEQVPWGAADRGPRLPLPRYRGDRNDLTIGRRLIWIGAIALGGVVILGALITISSGVVRLVSQILRAFA
jgi:DNA-binding CsgD family transcriptional regulator